MGEIVDPTDQPDAALAEQGDAVADRLDQAEKMRREDDGHALALQFGDKCEQFLGRLRIEAGSWLVEDRDPHLLHQHLGDPEALAHAA